MIGICFIELSNVLAGSMLADHLSQLGHRHIAFVSTPLRHLTLARQQRLQGVRAELERLNANASFEMLVAPENAEADSLSEGIPYEFFVGRQMTARLLRKKNERHRHHRRQRHDGLRHHAGAAGTGFPCS